MYKTRYNISVACTHALLKRSLARGRAPVTRNCGEIHEPDGISPDFWLLAWVTSFISAPGSGVSRVNSRRVSNSMEITWLPCGRPIDIGTIYNLESKAARSLGIGAGYKFVTIRFRPRHSPMQMHFVFNEPATESPPSPCSWSSWYFQRIKTWVPPRVLKSYLMFDLDNTYLVNVPKKINLNILFVRTYPYIRIFQNMNFLDETIVSNRLFQASLREKLLSSPMPNRYLPLPFPKNELSSLHGSIYSILYEIVQHQRR